MPHPHIALDQVSPHGSARADWSALMASLVVLFVSLWPQLMSAQPLATRAGAAASNAPADPGSPPGRLDAILRRVAQNGGAERIRVVVTVARGHGLDNVGQAVRAAQGDIRRVLPNVGAVVADVPAHKLTGLANSAHVRAVSADAPLQAVDGNAVQPVPGPMPGIETLRDVLGLPPASPQPADVGVVIIDSGLSPDSDFSSRITAFVDFTTGGVASAPTDPYGHGTHVAGIIASSGSDSSQAQYRGVATQARLIGLRVLDGQGVGPTSLVLQAIEFAIAQRDALGIDVINLSLGHPIYESGDTDPLVGAVEAAVRAGIVVVASAGNFGYNRVTDRVGYGGITSPGNAPSAITVGVLHTANTTSRDDDQVAPYSSRGPSWYDATAKPDLVAPGESLIANAPANSTLSQTYPSIRVDGTHIRLSGSSMAAAVTSGVVALMIETNRRTHPHAPSLTPNAIKALLQFSATPVGVTSSTPPDPLTQGAGAINVPAALELARAIDPSRPAGTDWLSGAVSPQTAYDHVTLSWSQTITWRTTPVAGDLLGRNLGAWGLAVPWGAATSWPADLILEPDVVWSAGIPWSSTITWGAGLVGSCAGGQICWGSLASVVTSGQTFTWGSTDPSLPPQP